MRYESRTAAELTTAECQAWNGLRRGDPVLASPYFSPEFFLAVSRVTGTARVVVASEAGRPVGFLPFHRRVMGLGGPIGGHLSDIHGLVADPDAGVEPCQVVRATGLPVFSMRHAPAGLPGLQVEGARHAFYVMGLESGYRAYEERRKPFAKSAFRAIRVRAEKAAKEYGSVTHRFWDLDGGALDRLIAWKRQQYAETRQIDVFSFEWVCELVRELFAAREPALRGQLSCLYFGEELAAAHFGLRTPEVLHYWFPGYEPRFAEFSPGNILLRMMAEEAAGEGCSALHLGPGEYRYKLELADRSFPVVEAMVAGPSLPGQIVGQAARLVGRASRWLPARLADLPARAARRLDRQIAFRAA